VDLGERVEVEVIGIATGGQQRLGMPSGAGESVGEQLPLRV